MYRTVLPYFQLPRRARMSSYHHLMLICTVLFFILLAFATSFLIWYWCNNKTATTRLRDIVDHQCDPTPTERAAQFEGRHDEPKPVLITLPSDVRISPHGKRYHTSPSCSALSSTAPILKGLCTYCHNRDRPFALAKNGKLRVSG